MIDDFTTFNKNSVIDTCSLLTLVSSRKLDIASKTEKCYFAITDFIEYELLYKTRNIDNNDLKLRRAELDQAVIRKLDTGEINKFALTISDLHAPLFARHNKARSRGELTAIVLAEKFNIGFVTDDFGAQKIAKRELGKERVDSICSFISWLYYNNKLIDSDINEIISDQEQHGRGQEKQFRKAYMDGLEVRMMQSLMNFL